MKRQTVTASSIGSYFGVGFNTPEDQLDIDLGLKEPVFSEEQIIRMELGNHMENVSLDWFENHFQTPIYERNTETLSTMDGLVRVRIDGMMDWHGEPTVVENKYSNSDVSFLQNVGYLMQVQIGMEAKGCKQGFLLGMHKGKPVSRLVRYDKEFIEDARIMAEDVGAILRGVADRNTFPYYLVEKYSSVVPAAENVPFEDEFLLQTYLAAVADAKEANNRVDELKQQLLDAYPATVFENDEVKLTIQTYKRKGSLDMDKLLTDHPEIEIDRFYKPDSEYRMVKATVKKPKKKAGE